MVDESWRRASLVVQLLALTGAALWSAGLLVFATTVPVYQTETGSTSSHSDTLVDENGMTILIVLAVPLAATLLVALALLIRRRWALWAACAITAVHALGNAAALLTVGIVVLPVTAALVVACVCAAVRSLGSDQVHGSVPGARRTA